MSPGARAARLLPSLYAIADASALERAGFGLGEGASRMLLGGARLVQLRGKGLTSERFLRHVEAALETARSTGGTVVVNDRVDVALAAGAHGVHLGQDDLDPARARAMLGAEALIGYSTHSLGQGLGARRLPVDYVAVGPVSTTTSKERPDPVVPAWLPAALRGALGLPVVAIGGIRSESARLHLARGASSVAVISDLLREGDPGRGVARFLEALAGA